MANNKIGLIYYKVDTDRYQDKRIRRLKKEMGCAGIAVYDFILCEVYRVKGCFIEWDENTVYDAAEYFNLKETLISEIVNYCLAVGLFNKELFMRERVLSSYSIQQRYIQACIKAKRVDPNIPEEYLITPEESPKPTEECDITPEESLQSKVKERKGKKSKVFVPPSVFEVIEYFRQKGYTEAAAIKAHEYYEAGEWKDSQGHPVLSWKQKVIANWFKPENKIQTTGTSGKMVY